MENNNLSNNIWIYMLIMAVVTYLIRVLPLTLIRKEIRNKTVRSFLYYVPYVTLSVMTFPAIITATSSIISGIIGFAAAIVIAVATGSLFKVATGACAAVFLVEIILENPFF